MTSRTLAGVAVGLIASVVPLAVTASPASAAGTGTVTTPNSTLNVRSAPNTTSAVVGRISNGSRITLECWVTGQTVSGNWGATCLWHRSSGGYVSDGFVYTGTNGPASGEPACGSSTPTPASREQRALTWARGQLGATGWNGWCDRFVANAYGKSNSGYATAYAHFQNLRNRGLIRTTGTPPAGALVFFAPAKVNGNAGHVMLSEGNGSYITSAATVRRVSLSWPGAAYIGWAYANPEWPGR